MERIQYPSHLNSHTLTEQELNALTTPGQQALAKDWNIINRKIDWLITNCVEHHNRMVEHEKSIENWNRIYWLLGLMAGGVVTTLAVAKLVGWLR